MPTLYDYGPALVDIRLTRGDDFEMILGVEGDRDADSFAAALRPARGSTITAFTTAVGSYNAGTDRTPVTVSMTDTASAALAPGLYVWDLEWTSGGVVRTVAAGELTVLTDYTP